MAVQLAHLLGAVPVGTSSKAEKLAFLQSIGVEQVGNYASLDFEAVMRSLTGGRGFDVVLNMLSGAMIQTGLNLLGSGGRYIELAVHGLKTAPKLDLSGLMDNQEIKSMDLRRMLMSDGVGQQEVLREAWGKLVEWVEQGRIYSVVSRVYPLSMIDEGMSYVESGRHIGKVVISHTATVMQDYEGELQQQLVHQKQQSQRSRIALKASGRRSSSILMDESVSTDIVIIGYYGQFPEAENADELWAKGLSRPDWPDNQATGFYLKLNLLKEEILDTVSEVLEIDRAAYHMMGHQQQVVFHALAQAIQQAGLSKKALKSSSTGVFVTAGQSSELNGANSSKAEDHAAHMLPARISFELDLKGPSEIHNASCTSTYLLIHKAIQSMQLGECDQALVIGINLISEKTADYGGATDLQALLSNTGVMKSFDDTADGMVRSEGVGVVLLKKKKEAERDQNKIYGLVKGTSFVHGGKNLSWEAPNPKGLKAAITSSIEKSGVEVDTIDYIEAHGIANPIADAIELSAISEAYRHHSKATDKKWYVGSVKPVVGHPELASGMASLLKVLKAFEHQTIPGIAGLGEVTKELASDHSLILPKAPVAWESGVHPRRAALNSYAVGGVNAHIILEEYPGNGKGLSRKMPTLAESESSPPEMKKETQKGSTEGLRAQLLSLAAATFEMDGETIDLKASPIDYDFDSVKVIQFARRVNEYFGIEIKMGQMLNADNFESMFRLFEEAIIKSKTATKDVSDSLEEGLSTVHPLSEVQKGYYFMQLSEPSSVSFNLPAALEVEGKVDPEKI
ncbi:MAG: beta-ketoacyl synthase N-terminal-like domain-containing protein, partial [Verrucomicrobiota bacterium]